MNVIVGVRVINEKGKPNFLISVHGDNIGATLQNELNNLHFNKSNPEYVKLDGMIIWRRGDSSDRDFEEFCELHGVDSSFI